MASVKYKSVKGMQDLEPDKAYLQQYIIDIFTKWVTLWGAQKLDTPIVERVDVLMEKYGDDSDKQIFNIVPEDNSDKEFTDKDTDKEFTALRYDLTVPFSRWVKSRNIKKIKRYSIGNVFRQDQPNMKAGRYRQFLQADYDKLGEGDSVYIDAETLILLNEILKEIIPLDIMIRINTREILNDMLQYSSVPEDKYIDVIRVVDKLDKKTWKQVLPELSNLVDPPVIDELGNIIKIWKNPRLIGDWINEVPFISNSSLSYLNNLRKNLGPDVDNFMIDFTLARGLDYYTGIIFEAIVTGKKYKKTGSIAAGGRYDNLCGVPCVGFSVGIDRIMTVLPPIPKNKYSVKLWLIQINKDIRENISEENIREDISEENICEEDICEENICEKNIREDISEEKINKSKIEDLYDYRKYVLRSLRLSGLSADTEPKKDVGLGPQIRYVLKKQIPYIVFIGIKEMNNNTISIKDMEEEFQYDDIDLDEFTKLIKQGMSLSEILSLTNKK